MQLVNEFRVPVPIGQAWDVLTDVERVAPCIPGAELLGVDGDDFTGAVKVKVGPITVQYKGNGTFLEKDEAAHRAVIKGTAKETRGQGNASAIITAELKDEGDATACVLTTDLTISGKAAQFGRGVLADVSSNLIGQFAERLEADLLAGSATCGPRSARRGRFERTDGHRAGVRPQPLRRCRFGKRVAADRRATRQTRAPGGGRFGGRSRPGTAAGWTSAPALHRRGADPGLATSSLNYVDSAAWCTALTIPW